VRDITVSFGREGRMNRNKEKDQNVFIKFDVSFREEQLAELKGAPLSVFICLALHMDENGECWLTNERLMKETGYKQESTIRSAKKFLVENGYLEQAEQRRWTKDLVIDRFPKNYKEKMKEVSFGTWAPASYRLFPETTDPHLTEVGQDRHGSNPTRMKGVDKEEPSFELEPVIKEEPVSKREVNNLSVEEEQAILDEVAEKKKQKKLTRSQPSKIRQAIEKNWSVNKVNPNWILRLRKFAKVLGDDLVVKAIEESKYEEHPFYYCCGKREKDKKGILNNWIREGVTSVSDMNKKSSPKTNKKMNIL